MKITNYEASQFEKSSSFLFSSSMLCSNIIIIIPAPSFSPVILLLCYQMALVVESR
jgi:hypothetical protein